MKIPNWLRFRRATEQIERSTAAPPSSSPIDLYVRGGGDLSTASPFTQALLMEAERGHAIRWPGHAPTQAPRERTEDADATRPATLDEYLKWMTGYIQRGGTPTHYYDYPFSNVGMLYAQSCIDVDSAAEYGARSRRILIPSGILAKRTDPRAGFDGWGHTNLYLMEGFTQIGHLIPVYSDPEFDPVLTAEHREERAKSQRRHAEFAQGIAGRRDAR